MMAGKPSSPHNNNLPNFDGGSGSGPSGNGNEHEECDPDRDTHHHHRHNQNQQQRGVILDRQFLSGNADLLDLVDKKTIAYLRDGKMFIGWLRSVDQFGNLTMSQTIERLYEGKYHGETPRGVVLVRGDNLAFVGEIDLAKEGLQKDAVHHLQRPFLEILSMKKKTSSDVQQAEESRRHPHHHPHPQHHHFLEFLGEDEFADDGSP